MALEKLQQCWCTIGCLWCAVDSLVRALMRSLLLRLCWWRRRRHSIRLQQFLFQPQRFRCNTYWPARLYMNVCTYVRVFVCLGKNASLIWVFMHKAKALCEKMENRVNRSLSITKKMAKQISSGEIDLSFCKRKFILFCFYFL